MKLKDLIKYCIDNDFTLTQYIVLYLQNKGQSKITSAYIKHSKKFGVNVKEQILNLERRGYLEATSPGKFKITRKGKDVFTGKFDAANEFWEAYPGFGRIKGKTIPLSTMDFTVFRHMYNDLINDNREEHDEIMKDLKYDIERGLTVGMGKYLSSRMYLKTRQERKSGGSNGTTGKQTLTKDF